MWVRETINAEPTAFKAEGQDSSSGGLPRTRPTLSVNHARLEIDPDRPAVERALACEILTVEKLANGCKGHVPASQAAVGSSTIHSAELSATAAGCAVFTNDQWLV